MSRPWMPLYVADYIRDTRHLSTAEHGAYLLLIMHYWAMGSLPDDDRRLARITGMSEAEWAEARPIIQSFFHDGWKHDRIDQELAEAERVSEAGKRAGKASAAARRKPVPTETPESLERSVNDPPNDSPTIPQPLQPQSQKEDRMVDAPAREPSGSKFTEGSKALAMAFWTAVGIADPLEIPPELAGVDWRAVEWERAGWTVDLVGVEARRLALDRPLKPLKYFEKVFATAFAKRQSPLPIVEVRDAEKLTVTHGPGKPNGRPGSLIAAIDREIADLQAQEGIDPEVPASAVLRLSR